MSSNFISYQRTPKQVNGNGNDWLFGVHHVSNNTNNKTGYIIGFVPAEDHFYDPETGFPPWTHYAYKSIAPGNTHNI